LGSDGLLLPVIRVAANAALVEEMLYAKPIVEVASPAMRAQDVSGPFVKVSSAADTFVHVDDRQVTAGRRTWLIQLNSA
jgi:hypothetical protein